MFHSILCATDFSRGGRHALDVAARWAEAYGAALEVVHVVSPLVARGLVPSSSVLDEIAVSLRNDAEQTLENAVAELQPRVRATGRVVEGFARDEIVRQAKASKADLVVVGTAGEHLLTRVVVGSTADRVVRTSDCAVLVVPLEASVTLPRVILAPTDLSPASRTSVRVAYDLAAPLAAPLAAKVEVVHAYQVPFFADRSRAEITDLPVTLAARVRAFHGLDASARVHVVEDAAPAAIGHIAEAASANLIVMGAHSGTVSRLLGGVTDRVLRTSPTCVLVVHAAPTIL